MSVELKSLSKDYQQAGHRIAVLKGIDQKIADGELVAVVGHSGSGKSTLLSLLAGLDRPTAGAIRIRGEDIVTMDENTLTKFRGAKIGIVFQQYHLIPHLTALENVMVPLEILGRENPESTARSMLAEMQLEHRHDHLPSQLSGGECQRVAIARALVTSPELLLADEPSGSLDPATGEAVMAVFFRVARAKAATSILVTHNEELAKRCDRILRLQGGNLVEVP